MWRRRGAIQHLQASFRRVAVRRFAYEDTFAYRIHGPKPLAVVIHPVLPTTVRPKIGETRWNAEEALGLARANRWDILPGPMGEPYRGWNKEALAEVDALEEQRRLANDVSWVPEGWHLDRGEEESDEEYDVNEEAWRHGVVKRQWAETCIVKVRHVDTGTFFGKGKVQELAVYIAENPCDYVFVNTTLTPTQIKNLEYVFNNATVAAQFKERRDGERLPGSKGARSVEVFDRNRLVLEIFHLRARTPAAKVQVGLARLAYLKTRLTLGTKARLRETMKVLQEHVGPFHEVSGFKSDVDVQYHYETQPFETERVLLRIAEQRLKRAMETARHTRKQHQSNREGIPTIGIVGYTNAGKTSLMNRITNAGLKERDLLFQTLDTTLRRVRLPSGGQAIIADSIGFIQDLPHQLFAAFQATLDELVNCDVLIHVRDIAHPQCTMQKKTVLETLRSAGVPEGKLASSVIEVWNKIDLLPALDYVPPEAVPICAADGTGVKELLHLLDTVIGLQKDQQRRTVSFPVSQMSRAMTFLHRHAAVDEETLVVDEGSGGGVASIDAIFSAADWGRWQAKFPPHQHR